MTTAPSMPLFCGDFIADTTHLTMEQSGAYLQILMVTWRNNGKPLPDDSKVLARVCRMTTERFDKAIRPALADFFDLSAGTWRSARLEKEWEFVQKSIAVKRANGAKGGRPKSLKNNEPPKATGSVEVNLEANLNESTQPQPQYVNGEDTSLPSDIPESSTGPSGPVANSVAYAGRVISLKAKQFDEWRRRYSAIPDFLAALQTFDEELFGKGKRGGDAYAACQRMLLNKHERLRRQAAEEAAAKVRPVRRSGNPNIMDRMPPREAVR